MRRTTEERGALSLVPSARPKSRIARWVAGSVGHRGVVWRIPVEMLRAPQRYIDWINKNVGFNPRSQAHSDALTEFVFDDLEQSLGSEGLRFLKNVGMDGYRHPPLTKILAKFSAVATGPSEEEPDAEEAESALDTNIDGVATKHGDHSASPRTVLAIENKTIMTAHAKARTNRWNDARAFAGHVHDVDPSVIAGFTIAINTSLTYRNPDKFSSSAATSGKNNAKAVATTLGLFSSRSTLPLRKLPDGPRLRCEAVWIIALEYDGRTATARLDTQHALAPAPRARCSYEDFVNRIVRAYSLRFAP